MRVKLTVSRGKNAGKAFDVNVPQFVIGRAKGCQLRPQSDAISRQHCAICVTKEGVTIRDLGSRNGTIVNGEKIEGTFTLSHGDDLRVGPLFLTVDLQTKSTTTPPANTETLAASSDETIATTPAKSDPPPEPTPTRVLPAQPSSKADSDSGEDIGAWLEEEDRTDDTKIRAAETLRFRLDESEQIEIKKAVEETEVKEEEKDKKGKKKKKELGKLPERKKDVTNDSREAAEATLKKMFNRGL